MKWREEASRCATPDTNDSKAGTMKREAFGPTNKING